jgi:hypothetical protein
MWIKVNTRVPKQSLQVQHRLERNVRRNTGVELDGSPTQQLRCSPRAENASPITVFLPSDRPMIRPTPGWRRGHASPHDARADVTPPDLGADANDATAQVATPPAPHPLGRHGGSSRPQALLHRRPPLPLWLLRRGAPT